MTEDEKEQRICADAALIDSLGGAAAVARMLKMTGPQAMVTRRVQHWKERGIPAKWKLAHPKLLGGKRR